MQIKTFHAKLKEQSIPITIEALTKYLGDLGLEDVPQSMVADLTADIKKDYVTALELANQGRVTLKTDENPAQPPAKAPQQEIPVTFPGPTQATSVIQSTIVQLVQANHSEEQEAIAALAGYYAESPTRVMAGINQQLSTMGVNNPLESVLQQQRESWSSAHSAIAEAIANVNTAAGLSNAA